MGFPVEGHSKTGNKMPRESKQTSRHYDFQVEQRKTYIPHENGYRWTGKWSNVRTDTGESLGDGISEQYGLLQNSVLVETLEEAFQDYDELKSWGKYTPNGFEQGKRDITIAENGARFFGTYEFAKQRPLGAQVGDTIGMQFTLRNSFDRSCKAGIELGGKRLACLNGMTRTESLMSITARHSNKINVGTIKDGIDQAVESWNGMVDGFAKFVERDITREQGVFILNRMAQKKVLSEAMKDSIELIWNGQEFGSGRGGEFDKDRNLFNLYNATTEHLTHEVRPKRFEYARKVDTAVLSTLSRAVAKKEKWDDLISPCKSKKERKAEEKASTVVVA